MFLIISLYAVTIPALLFLSALVYLNNRRHLPNILFSGFLCVVSVWMILTFFADISSTESSALELLRYAVLIGNMPPLLFMYFALSFGETKQLPRLKMALLALPTVLLMIGSFSEDMIHSVEITEFGAQPMAGALYTLQSLYTVVYFLSAFYLLHRTGKRSSLVVRNQIKYMILALAIGVTVNIVISLIFVTFDGPAGSILGVLPSFLLLGGIISFAIVKHRLFDVRLVVARASAYFLLLLVLAIGYAITLAVVSLLIFDETTDTERILVFSLLAVGLSFVIGPLKRYLDRLTSSIFYRDLYLTREVLERLNTELVSTIDAKLMAQQALDILSQAVKPESALMYARGSDGIYEAVARVGSAQRLARIKIQRFIASKKQVSAFDDNPERMNSPVALAVSLDSGDSNEGLILFGNRRSGGTYTNQDLQMLSTAASSIGLALGSANKYTEIQSFAEQLESRVRKATRQLRITNKKLMEADQTKDDFISMASHQLRPKMTAAQGFVELLKKSKDSKFSKEGRELIDLTDKSIARMSELVVDMLDISRMQSGQIELNLQKHVDMLKLVEDEVAAFDNRKENDRMLKLTAPKKLPRASVDIVKIREVVGNLIANADQYSPEDKPIDIRIKKTREGIEVAVTDKGIGMDAEAEKKVFTKFFRAGNAKKVRPNGSGIGLYMAKKIVEAHKGEMVLKTAEGKGTSIGFRLPSN